MELFATNIGKNERVIAAELFLLLLSKPLRVLTIRTHHNLIISLRQMLQAKKFVTVPTSVARVYFAIAACKWRNGDFPGKINVFAPVLENGLLGTPDNRQRAQGIRT